MTDPWCCYLWCSMDPINIPSIYTIHVSINIPAPAGSVMGSMMFHKKNLPDLLRGDASSWACLLQIAQARDILRPKNDAASPSKYGYLMWKKNTINHPPVTIFWLVCRNHSPGKWVVYDCFTHRGGQLPLQTEPYEIDCWWWSQDPFCNRWSRSKTPCLQQHVTS